MSVNLENRVKRLEQATIDTPRSVGGVTIRAGETAFDVLARARERAGLEPATTHPRFDSGMNLAEMLRAAREHAMEHPRRTTR